MYLIVSFFYIILVKHIVSNRVMNYIHAKYLDENITHILDISRTCFITVFITLEIYDAKDYTCALV